MDFGWRNRQDSPLDIKGQRISEDTHYGVYGVLSRNGSHKLEFYSLTKYKLRTYLEQVFTKATLM